MITLEPSTPSVALLDELSTEDFLQVIGQRVRQQRARKSMSRKRLAEVSTVSERYLAQLESGQGNMSIALLRKVTAAIGITLEALMSEQVTETCASRIRSRHAADGEMPLNGVNNGNGEVASDALANPAVAASDLGDRRPSPTPVDSTSRMDW